MNLLLGLLAWALRKVQWLVVTLVRTVVIAALVTLVVIVLDALLVRDVHDPPDDDP